MNIDFTPDELYFIEKLADDQSAQGNKNIYTLAEMLLLQERKGHADIAKHTMRTIQEHDRTIRIADSIRMKCEISRQSMYEDAKEKKVTR